MVWGVPNFDSTTKPPRFNAVRWRTFLSGAHRLGLPLLRRRRRRRNRQRGSEANASTSATVVYRLRETASAQQPRRYASGIVIVWDFLSGLRLVNSCESAAMLLTSDDHFLFFSFFSVLTLFNVSLPAFATHIDIPRKVWCSALPFHYDPFDHTNRFT